MSDQFSFREDQSRSSGGATDLIWNLGSILLIVMTLALLGYFGLIFLDPNSSWNFFKPSDNSGVQVNIPPTFTPRPTNTTGPVVAPGTTEVPGNNAGPTATNPGVNTGPTATSDGSPLLPTVTPFGFAPGGTATQVSTQQWFELKDGTFQYVPYSSCDGNYLGGNVVDINGNPIEFMIVRLSGTINGVSLGGAEDSFSGTVPQYGDGGYEIQITTELTESTGTTLFVQVVDPETDAPLSDIVLFGTHGDCNRNLVIFNWVEVQAP